MELRNRETGAILAEDEFRRSHPNTSFPQVLTPEILEDFGYDPILEGPQAAVTPPYQFSQRNGIEKVGDNWFTKYVAGPIFEDFTDDEGNLHTASEQEIAYKAQKDQEQALGVRQERNRLLAECDWTQLADAPVSSQAWADYRQALRSVPEQTGFPWTIEWPEKP